MAGLSLHPLDTAVAALTELATDKLPSTPSRKVPQQFGARLVSGGLAGAALASASASGGGSWIVGLVAGVAGAVVGTLGGAAARAALMRLFGRGTPAALVEDLVAIVLGIAVVLHA